LHEIVANLHLNHGADPGEAVDHDRDQSAVAQPEEIRLIGRLCVIGRFLGNGDALEQRMGLFGRQDRRLAFLDRVAGVTTPNVKNSTLRPTSHRCAAANGLRALNFPCEPPGCLPRVVPGEIKVLPSDGRGMAKRLVVDLNAMFPQGGHQYAPPDEQLPPAT